jgi:hypothetical protein
MINVQTNTYKSSTVEASTYDFNTKQLIVTFKNAAYAYQDVKAEDYIAFRDAESQGKALNQYIKGYTYEKIED